LNLGYNNELIKDLDIFGKVRKPESKIIGRVYKIISDNTKYVYIGSTINTLHQRLKQHILDSKTNKTNISSREIIKHGGNIQIVLLEEIFFKERKELLLLERHYYDLYRKICINYNKPCKKIWNSNAK